jgi:uncharacterized protein YndB with AHSA1/START domain
MGKVKFDLEYVINCSPKVLYNRLSTASGLAEWFANDVSVKGKIYIFIWDGVGQEAEITFAKENHIVRFNWLEDNSYFEFKITRDELTGDVSLIITDYSEPDEVEEIKSIWNSQVAKLKQLVGS